MLASSRFRSDSAAGRSRLRPRLALTLLLAGLLVAAMPHFAAAAGAAAPDDLGNRIHARFRVWVEDESIRLRPVEGDPAIRSIELEDGEEEVAVNGKAFTADELRAFLGKDGELIAELAALDDDERRAALGLDEGGASVRVQADGSAPAAPAEPAAPSDPATSGGLPIPPIPPVPGLGHIRVESEGDDRVSFGRSIEIGPEETTGDAVCIGCSITVLGEVAGDAVAVGGSVHVEGSGHVNGNAVGVGGKVRLDTGATVEGDAVAVGGSVQVEEGATVEGQKSTVGWGSGWKGHESNGVDLGWPFWFDSDFGEVFWSLLRAFFLLMLCCIAVLVARGPMEHTSRRLTEEPWKAVFAGLLTQLLFFPVLLFVTVILAVSIVGIPLLILVPVAVLALLVATLLGFASVAQSLGRWAGERFGWNLTEPFLPVVVGVALIQGVTVLARIVGLPGGFLGLVAFTLVALGFFLKYAAWTMGLGAMTLSLLARDWRRPVSGPERPMRFAPPSEPAAEAEVRYPPVPPPAPVEAPPVADASPDAESGSQATAETAVVADDSPTPPAAKAAPARPGDDEAV